MSDTLILLPTYNNAGTLEDVLRRCLATGLPVLVVDDGSTDGTSAVLDKFKADAARKMCQPAYPPINSRRREVAGISLSGTGVK